MFQPRPREPAYALLARVDHARKNRYGQAIETVPKHSPLRNQSLNINNDSAIGQHPDRYKQHGFYFTADNCIACHACEAACSEKNDLPAHIAFRSVGYIEGGAYPAYQRLNISMACNHCDDPVCLKGCPTRAYTKFAEYGAVLQDPDICFGCGYCTWVCPYNAPQLDTQAGHVSKCNMCVDRLEAGLKPACVSACLAGALDFGVTETRPANRSRLDSRIPGFPTPDITHPNIRFQQTRSLPEEMRRPDSMPLKYMTKNNAGASADGAAADKRWGFKKLSTRENPLVVFTLVSQLVIGAFLILFLGPMAGLTTLSADNHPVAWPLLLFGLIGAQTLALVLSTLHLGRPHRFYRAFNNLKYSPVSREVAGIAVFYNFLGLYALLSGLPMVSGLLADGLSAGLILCSGFGASLAGLVALYFMHSIYRIPARPFWNHWYVLAAFYGNMLTLGGVIIGSVFIAAQISQGLAWLDETRLIAAIILAGLCLEGLGLWRHAIYLQSHSGESQASYYQQCGPFGKTYWLRNYAIIGAAVMLIIYLLAPALSGLNLLLWPAAAITIIISAVLGRALFYAVVIPTTMPGAFFWKNKGFEEHARESGLTQTTETGILADSH